MFYVICHDMSCLCHDELLRVPWYALFSCAKIQLVSRMRDVSLEISCMGAFASKHFVGICLQMSMRPGICLL